MDTQGKLDILSRDAQYDLSCACATTNPAEHRTRSRDGSSWLYPVTTASGGAGIMLKTLMGNRCANDCRYCPLRENQDFRAVALKAEEVASFFYDLQRKRGLIGIFLSSAVLSSADKTMQLLVDAARILRCRYRYRGFIHLKVIPGCSLSAIDEALTYASALSLNIEVPSSDHFSKLSTDQDYQRDIMAPLHYLCQQTAVGMPHAKVGISSQYIVGASDEDDREILSSVNDLYRGLGVGRVYFSAYQRGLGEATIPGEQVAVREPDLFGMETSPAHLMREHRLYQAEWLLRTYGFGFQELPFLPDGRLSLDKDPKLLWAEANPHRFPLSVNRASREELLRVPGIGPAWATRIVATRCGGRIKSIHDLGMGDALLLKAARYLTL